MISKGQARAGLDRAARDIRARALGGQMIPMNKVGCQSKVRRQVMLSRIELPSIPTPASAHLHNLMACEIVEKVYAARGGLADTPTVGIVDIAGGAATIHLLDAVLRVIGV